MKIEIEKPVVPQFVADLIEERKEENCADLAWENNSIYNTIDNLIHDIKTGWISSEVNKWLYKDIKNEIALEKALILGYEVEQPLYYARMKGHEAFRRNECTYFRKVDTYEGVSLGEKDARYGSIDNKMAKADWKALGINESNADFEEVK